MQLLTRDDWRKRKTCRKVPYYPYLFQFIWVVRGKKTGHHDLWWQLATHHLWSGGPSKISWNPQSSRWLTLLSKQVGSKLLHSFFSEFLRFLHSWSFDSGFPPSSQTTMSSNSFFLDTPYPALIPVIFRLVQRGFTFSHFFSSIDPSLSISADLEMLRDGKVRPGFIIIHPNSRWPEQEIENKQFGWNIVENKRNHKLSFIFGNKKIR